MRHVVYYFIKLEYYHYPPNIFSPYLYSLNKNKNQFTPYSEIHNYATRQQINFHLPQVNLTKCQKGIGYLGIKVFKKLPQYLKVEFDNPKKFKESLKNYLSVKTFYSLQEYFEL